MKKETKTIKAAAKKPVAKATAKMAKCAFCVKPFEPKTAGQKYCSEECYKAAKRKRRAAAAKSGKVTAAPKAAKAAKAAPKAVVKKPVAVTAKEVVAKGGTGCLLGRKFKNVQLLNGVLVVGVKWG